MVAVHSSRLIMVRPWRSGSITDLRRYYFRLPIVPKGTIFPSLPVV